MNHTPLSLRLISFSGVFVFLFTAWLLSTNRSRPPVRVLLWGMGLHMMFAIAMLKTEPGLLLFTSLNHAVSTLLNFTSEGSRFLFGDYADQNFTVAFNVLPTIIFFSSLVSVLYHLGVLQRVVTSIAWLMQRTMRTSASETMSAVANIFVGQTEAPLVVRPYVSSMSMSELNAVMVGGFATVAGGVMVAYVNMLQDTFPDIAGHLISATVMSAPASLVVAKLLVPTGATGTPDAVAEADLDERSILAGSRYANVIDAAAQGAAQGMQLTLNVAAMLFAFWTFIQLLNFVVGLPFELWNQWVPSAPAEPLTLQGMLGVLFWPFAFFMGTPVHECGLVGALLGEKMVLNEFIAYSHLGKAMEASQISPRATTLASYALCGFANFGSIAIQLGGIGGIAPSRRQDLARLGMRAMFGGTLVACINACVAGVLL